MKLFSLPLPERTAETQKVHYARHSVLWLMFGPGTSKIQSTVVNHRSAVCSLK